MSKFKVNEKICKAKLAVKLKQKEADITSLHTDECLERIFGTTTIMPSVKK